MASPTAPPKPGQADAPGKRRRRTRTWVGEPMVRAFTGLPLALAAMLQAASVSRPVSVPATQVRSARRRAARGPGRGRIVAHGLLVAVPATVAFVLAALAVVTVFGGYLYPLRPDVWPTVGSPFTGDHRLDGAWGGPTMVGAWLVHASAALGFQAAALVLITALVRVQDWITGRLL